jgi:hypothetical protein
MFKPPPPYQRFLKLARKTKLKLNGKAIMTRM